MSTFADWNKPPPGFLEIDLVAHCGDSMGGSFIHSLVATDVYDTLTEYHADPSIEFTLSRAYRKNDQAWVECQFSGTMTQ